MNRNAKPLTGSGREAKTLILIGLILQVVFGLIFLFGLGIIALLTIPTGFGLFLAGVWIVFGVLDFLCLFLIFLLCYRPTESGEYEQARTPTLTFGILSLIFAGVIPGILYIVGFAKLEDAVREQRQALSPPPVFAAPPVGWQPTAGTNPPLPSAGSPPPAGRTAAPAAFCGGCGTPFAPGQNFCPRCGRPRD